jgi:acetyl esterase/lipase
MICSVWFRRVAFGVALTLLGAGVRAQTRPATVERPLPASLPADQIEFQTGITFVERAGKPLNLDMARPKVGRGPRPAIVCIYGGGWISGSRTGMHPFARYLAGYGYVAVAPTYRLAPANPFPAAVADVRECVRWLRRHAKEYDIDLEHIGAMGLSAGGHLSCMLGLAGDGDRFGPDDKAPDGTSAQVQTVVNYFGPADMAAKDWSRAAVTNYLIPFLGGTAVEEPDNYRRASPITYVTKDDAAILTFQGDKDLTVPMSQAVALHKQLEKAGVKNKLVILPSQGHGWGEPHLSNTKRQMVRFFDENLKPKTESGRDGETKTEK